ncbi:MAG TPA: hypothetical protein VFJ64_10440 [Solirubrobacterales bacterium]|nr:hypothetical protein [Solirubrobacterales bacterium]
MFVSAAIALAVVLPATASASQTLTVTTTGTGTGTVTSSPAGINCGATCSFGFADNAVVMLTGAPGAITAAVVWTGCKHVNLEDECEVTMSTAKAVTAKFDFIQRPLKVTKAGSGSGTVTSSPAGIECGATCSAGYVIGTAVTLSALSDPNTLPVTWSGCGKIVEVGGEEECEVTMSTAKAVTATFELDPDFSHYTLTITKGGTGSGTGTSVPAGINCGSSCSAKVLSNTKVTLIATPAPGSVFARWSGGKCSGTGPCTRSINSTRTVKAVFNATGTRTLTIVMAGSGAGVVKSKAKKIECTASCSPSIAAGAKVFLTAVPATGSTFSGWSGACSGTKTCKVQMSEAHGVTASFAKVPIPSSTGTAIIARNAKVKGGKAFVGIRCGGPASCRGSLKLLARLGRTGKRAAIGSATFSLAPGSSTMLKIKLSAKAKRLLKSAGQLNARVTGAGIQARSLRLKL